MRKLLVAIAAILLLANLASVSLAHARECSRPTSDGGTRECSAMEEFDDCLVTAVRVADDRAERGDGNVLTRFAEFNPDPAHSG